MGHAEQGKRKGSNDDWVTHAIAHCRSSNDLAFPIALWPSITLWPACVGAAKHDAFVVQPACCCCPTTKNGRGFAFVALALEIHAAIEAYLPTQDRMAVAMAAQAPPVGHRYVLSRLQTPLVRMIGRKGKLEEVIQRNKQE